MTKGIYGYLDNKTNEIVYVGKDSNIDKDRRHKDHLSPSRYDDQPFNRVLQSNPDRYTYQVLVFDVEDDDTLNALEIQYIEALNPKFNFTEGGDGIVGFKHSEETKRKMSENNARYWQDKTHSEETRKKISESKKGKNHPQAKYTLWDINSVHYKKANMFKNGREPNPYKCFRYKYNGKDVNIGNFHDFVSCEIINELVKDAIGE